MRVEKSRQRWSIQRQNRLFEIERTHLLRRRQCARDTDHPKAARAEIVGHDATDQAGGAKQENVSRGCGHLVRQNGFAIISQRISITAPKPGKPNANQRRNSAK